MPQMWGADADALELLARRFRGATDQLDDIAMTLRSNLRSGAWEGSDAERMRDRFETYDLPALRRAAGMLGEASVVLARQAQQQRDASGSGGGPVWSGVGMPWFGGGGDPISFGDLRSLIKGVKYVRLIASLPRAWLHAQAIWDTVRLHRHLGGVVQHWSDLYRLSPSVHDWWKVRPGGIRIPFVGILLSGAHIAVNWGEYGVGDARTWDAMTGGAGGVGASVLAGPLGGVAWFASYEGTKWALDKTGAGDAIAGGAYDLAYGDRGDMTPSEAAAHSQRVENPLHIVGDMGTGAWRKVRGWF